MPFSADAHDAAAEPEGQPRRRLNFRAHRPLSSPSLATDPAATHTTRRQRLSLDGSLPTGRTALPSAPLTGAQAARTRYGAPLPPPLVPRTAMRDAAPFNFHLRPPHRIGPIAVMPQQSLSPAQSVADLSPLGSAQPADDGAEVVDGENDGVNGGRC